MSHWVAGGISAVLDQATVGTDISSATQGSSVASVAGKKRAPTKQWARAFVVNVVAMRVASASARGFGKDIGILRGDVKTFADRTAMHHALYGGPRGRATE